MILVDSDLLVIDQRHPHDHRFAVNGQVLSVIQAGQEPGGITSQALLEVVGKLSFNVPIRTVPYLPAFLLHTYRLMCLPNLLYHPAYAGCWIDEIINQMCQRMALGDAVEAVQIAKFAGFAQCLLTWNARHFRNKLVIPVLTPDEWLNQRTAGTP